MTPAFPGSGLSIRTRIIFMVIGTMILAILGTAYLIRGLINDHILKQKLTTVDILTTSVLHDLTYSGARDLEGTGQQIIAKYMTYYRIISSITIYGADSVSVASSATERIHQRTDDPEILAAISRARPNLHVFRPNLKNLGIRSVAPILQGSHIVGAVAMEVSIQDIQVTLSAIDRYIAVMMGVKLILVSVALFVLLRGTILLRLHRLIEVTQQLTAGNYAIQVEDTHGDEIGKLTRAFNQMATDLRASKEQIESYNRHLEERVHEATAQLQRAYEDLKSAQSHLVQNEKMASLGVLIAGVAHEINTPVGAILNVSRTLETHLAALPKNLELLRQDRELSTSLMVECLEELRASACDSRRPVPIREQRAVEAVLRENGMARWQECATVLCRLNFTDTERIVRYTSCLKSKAFFAVAESYASIAQAGTISQTSSQKIAEIVRALKYYAYSSSARVEMMQINESIATALVLLRNQFKHSVTVTTEYDPSLPPIPCTSDIHQVWTNLLTNAFDAIAESTEREKGAILVRTQRDGDTVVTSVIDNGVGIPRDKLDRIFDPFYTTKDIGKGTGLGLCIVSGIVNRHAGSIRIESKPGRTAFEVVLPIRVADEAAITREAGRALPMRDGSTHGKENGPGHGPADDRIAA